MRRRVYLYFVLTFLLGLIAGGTGTFFYAWNSGHWHHKFDAQGIVRDLRRELNLTDSQTQQLNQIMEQSMKRYSDLRKKVEPQFAAAREEGCNRIRQILTPEQLAKFNELVRRHGERRKELGLP